MMEFIGSIISVIGNCPMHGLLLLSFAFITTCIQAVQMHVKTISKIIILIHTMEISLKPQLTMPSS